MTGEILQSRIITSRIIPDTADGRPTIGPEDGRRRFGENFRSGIRLLAEGDRYKVGG
jgi:hypothetical protein